MYALLVKRTLDGPAPNMQQWSVHEVSHDRGRLCADAANLKTYEVDDHCIVPMEVIDNVFPQFWAPRRAGENRSLWPGLGGK